VRTILAVGTDVGTGASAETATAMSELTGAHVVARRVSDRRTERAMLALAQEEAADLIVVDAQLQRPADLARLVRPSLDAGFSVLAIPPIARTAPRVERIGVGHDGSPAAQRALAAAVDLVRIAGDAVAYLDVAYVDEALSSDEPHARELTWSRDAMIEWWLEALSDEVPALIRPRRLVGDPVRALADLSFDLDLLIVGTRRLSRVRRLLDGGVSAGLLVSARCPLLIVPGSRRA
jgi:nucleotide-binding universal stress UspA family protein